MDMALIHVLITFTEVIASSLSHVNTDSRSSLSNSTRNASRPSFISSKFREETSGTTFRPIMNRKNNAGGVTLNFLNRAFDIDVRLELNIVLGAPQTYVVIVPKILQQHCRLECCVVIQSFQLLQ